MTSLWITYKKNISDVKKNVEALLLWLYRIKVIFVDEDKIMKNHDLELKNAHVVDFWLNKWQRQKQEKRLLWEIREIRAYLRLEKIEKKWQWDR